MGELGRLLIIIGFAVIIIGVLVMALGRLGFFKLPGDFVWGSGNWRVYFPLASSIIISIILTLVLWLINYLRK